MSSAIKPIGASLFAASGFGSSFALAACCALPMGLSAVGLGGAGTSFLAPIVMATDPYSTPLRIVAAVSILLSVVLVMRAAKTCAPGDLCARRGFRLAIYAAAAVSAVLLALSLVYE